jgi:hypothetical protein
MDAIQYVGAYKTKDEAIDAFDNQTRQLGFLGGRFLADNKIQVFFEDIPKGLHGCKQVTIPDNHIKAMGIQR